MRDRSKESEKALGPAVAISVSTRHVRQVLSGQDKENKENRNSVPILSRVKTLRKVEAALEELLNLPEPEQLTKADEAILKAVPAFLAKLKASIGEESKQK
jgi:ParB family transcriptional regulator, chromosome partitioning protein